MTSETKRSALSPLTASRLEMAALNNGFDLRLTPTTLGPEACTLPWLAFASSQSPMRLWLSAIGDTTFLAALSQQNVATALKDHGTTWAAPLPPGALGAVALTDIPSIHRLVRRAFQLSRSLPNELLHRFQAEAGALPKSTEAERLVVQRIGQDIFRKGLLEYWDGRCAITGLALPALLRASHAKPWSTPGITDEERLDVHNGLLLAAHLDAAFDQGLISVADSGALLVSPALDQEACGILGLQAPLQLRQPPSPSHLPYLHWHRTHLFCIKI